HPDHPEWNVAVWLSLATLPGTPHLHAFPRDLERWLLARFAGGDGLAPPEGSKGWAYTGHAAWADEEDLDRYPEPCQIGSEPRDGWNAAVATLDALDPYRLFGNSFVDRLLV